MNNSASRQSGIFLAFDFGTRKIGVAVGQQITKTASPLAPLAAKQGVPRWEEVDKLIQTWQPQALIVGVPYQLDGAELAVTKLALRFISQLEEHYHLPTHAAEERLTTKAARSQLFAEGGYRALQEQSVDSIAATLILEEFMNKTGPSPYN